MTSRLVPWSKDGLYAEVRPPSAAEDGPHLFCGAHDIPGATCPNCQASLLRFFSFSPEPRLHLDFPVHLLFCWSCAAAHGPLIYRLTDNGGVELLEWRRGARGPGFPYEDYPASFPPGLVSLVPVSTQAAHEIALLNRGDFELERYLRHPPRHQFGGEPRLVQPLSPVTCPGCRALMPLFGTVADACLDPRGFTGNAFVQVCYYLCGDCRIVHGLQIVS